MITFLEWFKIREAEQKPRMDALDSEAEREGAARKKLYKLAPRPEGDFIQTARGARVSKVAGIAGHRDFKTRYSMRRHPTGFFSRGKYDDSEEKKSA